MTFILDLDFQKPGKKDLPGPPRVHIYVKTHTEDRRGLHFITPECVSLGELEYEIKQLHKELDDILKKAKRKFSAK